MSEPALSSSKAEVLSPQLVSFTNSTTSYSLSDNDGMNGIGGSTSISLSGTSTVTFTSPSSCTGVVAIPAGQLNLQSNGALGWSVGVGVASGAALQLQGGITVGSSPSIPLSQAAPGLTANAVALCKMSAAQHLRTITLSGSARPLRRPIRATR